MILFLIGAGILMLGGMTLRDNVTAGGLMIFLGGMIMGLAVAFKGKKGGKR